MVIAETARSDQGKPRRKFRRTISLVPTVFTVGNIFFGFYSIVYVLQGQYDQAARLIGFAVICDMLDGRLARLTNTTSEMGLQLDSLADVISFCLAPAILMNFWAFSAMAPFGWITSFIFLICGTMRLARFNVMAPGHKDFVGLPTPAAGGLIAAIVHFFSGEPLAEDLVIPLLVLVYLVSFLMISRIRYTGFKSTQTADTGRSARGRSSINILFLAVIVAGIYFYSHNVLILLAGAYLCSGPLMKLYSVARQKVGPKVRLAQPTGKP